MDLVKQNKLVQKLKNLFHKEDPVFPMSAPSNFEKVLLLVIFVGFFAITRLPYLDRDTVNPDSVNWHERSQQFVNGLKYFQLDKTYQHYQPGVTLMWLMGPTIELTKQLALGGEPYNEFSFPIYDYVAKITVLTAQLILSLTAIFLFTKFLGFRKSVLIMLLFSLEPFFIGNSRLVHLDVLMGFLLLNGLLLSYWLIKEFNWIRLVLTAIVFALAFLTKSIGVGGFIYAVFVGGFLLFLDSIKGSFNDKKQVQLALRKTFRYSGSLLIASLFFIFAFWPALWVNFKEVMGFLYYGAFRVGLAKGHNQIFLEGKTRDAGWLFYPVVMLYKTSIFTSLGILLNLILIEPKKILAWFKNLSKTISANKKHIANFVSGITVEHYLFLFYLGYFLVMSVSSKKIDRYAVVMFPMLSILAINGYYKYIFMMKSKTVYIIHSTVVALLFIYGLIVPIFSFYPYYFTYTNPLLGTPKYVHENILAQKPFGIGMYAVRDLINKKYGTTRDIALIDPKPMMSLYNKDHVFYLDSVGTRAFDTLVLGVNENMPGKVTKGKYEFEKADSIYINGLEYWRIYVRGAEKIKTP